MYNSITCAEFRAGLQKTRFAPVDMKELLECYFGETMDTNQEQREREQQKKQAFLEDLCQYFAREASSAPIAYQWMRMVTDQGKFGYQLIVREYAKDAVQAAVLVKHIGLALSKLQIRQMEQLTQQGETETERPLAVFAAEISGNPHYFDRGTTAGQLRSVALELIPMILTAGANIYYSGDLDPEGIDIADRLWQKYGDRIRIWRMHPEDYKKSISGEHISDARLAKLSHIQHPTLKETATCILVKRYAGYQENLLEELVKDVKDQSKNVTSIE